MSYETVQMLSDEDFKRSAGIQRDTFEQMLEVVVNGLRAFGRPPQDVKQMQTLYNEYRIKQMQSMNRVTVELRKNPRRINIHCGIERGPPPPSTLLRAAQAAPKIFTA